MDEHDTKQIDAQVVVSTNKEAPSVRGYREQVQTSRMETFMQSYSNRLNNIEDRLDNIEDTQKEHARRLRHIELEMKHFNKILSDEELIPDDPDIDLRA